MPQRFLIEYLLGERKGTRALIWSVDYDEFMARAPHEIKLISENPTPSELLMDPKTHQLMGGVLAQSEIQQMAIDPVAAEKFTADQITQLDKEHEAKATEKQRRDAIEKVRREVARG